VRACGYQQTKREEVATPEERKRFMTVWWNFGKITTPTGYSVKISKIAKGKGATEREER